MPDLISSEVTMTSVQIVRCFCLCWAICRGRKASNVECRLESESMVLSTNVQAVTGSLGELASVT